MVSLPSSIRGVTVLAENPTGVYIGLGSNLDHQNFSSPQLIESALGLLEVGGDHILAVSSMWTSDAWPPMEDAPNYTNAVCQVQPHDNDPAALLRRLHMIEAELGRQRDPANQWAERTMDLDLLDYNGLVMPNCSFVTLPHPRIDQRDFVLLPLLEISPNWVHPITGVEGRELLELIYQEDRTNQCRRITQIGLQKPTDSDDVRRC
jgi:2-amino-4-hydroxy-6-hydroxymethyldihydropteridine diphosphokinase